MSSRRLHLSPLPNGVAIVAALIAGGAVEACHIPTEIILVIDTNLTNYDVDQVSIAITGSQTKTIEISVAAAPPFPWALGLEPGGGAGAVEVSVAASLQGSPVLQKTAQTDFVDGEERMLRMLLLDACVGVSCPGTTSPQTCNAGACVSAEVSGTSLPAWTGSVPARPKPADSRGRTDHLGRRVARLRQPGLDRITILADWVREEGR